ncbi:MAG: phage/plasmid primase, P4 family, partial [Rhodospirillaceae bacterium]
LETNWTHRHEFSDLVEWLDWQRPVITAPTRQEPRPVAQDDNPYLAAAARLGFKPPLDVEKALAAVSYLANGDSGVHQTQLRVSASLVAQGVEDDEIVTLLMAATLRAAGPHARTWNWRREERALRAMIGTAKSKFVKPVEKPLPSPVIQAQSGTEAQVVSLDAERRKCASAPTDAAGEAPDNPERKAPGRPKKLSKGDDELALEFSKRHADTLKYVAKWGQWLRWDGIRWAIDETLFVQQAVRNTLRDIALASATKPGEMTVSAGTVAAVERLARSDPRHAATAEQFDADPWLLNTPGGIVDLRTGVMSPCDPAQLCSKATAIEPAPVLHDECPIWKGFLAHVLKNDQKLIDYLQKVIGYSLTGITGEQQLWFLHGSGRNGKGVFISTITQILGGYACVAGMETFTASNNDRHPTELARLIGARMVSSQETEEGRHWAESRIKSLTGGDPITAHFMRQDDFTFTPKFKLWFAGNHKPGLRNVDPAMAARVNMVPFDVFIPKHQRDKMLTDKLQAEWPAILRWAIDGCMKWQREGLERSDAVDKATDEYMKAEDSLANWLTEATETEGLSANESELVADLFASWKGWAEAAGETIGSMKRFSQKMIARGFEHGKQPVTKKALFRRIRLIRNNYTDDQRYGG